MTIAMGVGANIVGMPLAVHSPTSLVPKDMCGSIGPSVLCSVFVVLLFLQTGTSLHILEIPVYPQVWLG